MSMNGDKVIFCFLNFIATNSVSSSHSKTIVDLIYLRRPNEIPPHRRLAYRPTLPRI